MRALAFEYRAVAGDGNVTRGVLAAATREAAIRAVRDLGLTPVHVAAAAREQGPARGARVRTRDTMRFTSQLGVLVGARFSLGEALATIAEQEDHAGLRAAVLAIAARVQSGSSLASAMAEHPQIFSDVYVETVRAAERSGDLITVLDHLSAMLERADEVRRQVHGSLLYPACVVGVLSAAVMFLLGFAVPRFAGMFAQRGVELPTLTQALIGVGQFLSSTWYVLLPAGLVGAVSLRRAWQNPRTRVYLDAGLDRVPVVAAILQGMAVSRFARVLGISLGSGIDLIASLRMAGRASGRPSLAASADRLAEQVRAGDPFGTRIETCHDLPRFARRMLAAGDRAADLRRSCGMIADYYEREAMHLSKLLSTMIEPVLVVLIATVVLFVALAIFLPMWNLVQVLG